MVKFYLYARKNHPHQGKHDALQKMAYFALPIVAAVQVSSGLARELARLAGASPEARYIDFQSFDQNFHESWDIESATHPRRLLAAAQRRLLERPGLRVVRGHVRRPPLAIRITSHRRLF
jgi:hypothetical protein